MGTGYGELGGGLKEDGLGLVSLWIYFWVEQKWEMEFGFGSVVLV